MSRVLAALHDDSQVHAPWPLAVDDTGAWAVVDEAKHAAVPVLDAAAAAAVAPDVTALAVADGKAVWGTAGGSVACVGADGDAVTLALPAGKRKAPKPVVAVLAPLPGVSAEEAEQAPEFFSHAVSVHADGSVIAQPLDGAAVPSVLVAPRLKGVELAARATWAPDASADEERHGIALIGARSRLWDPVACAAAGGRGSAGVQSPFSAHVEQPVSAAAAQHVLFVATKERLLLVFALDGTTGDAEGGLLATGTLPAAPAAGSAAMVAAPAAGGHLGARVAVLLLDGSVCTAELAWRENSKGKLKGQVKRGSAVLSDIQQHTKRARAAAAAPKPSRGKRASGSASAEAVDAGAVAGLGVASAGFVVHTVASGHATRSVPLAEWGSPVAALHASSDAEQDGSEDGQSLASDADEAADTASSGKRAVPTAGAAPAGPSVAGAALAGMKRSRGASGATQRHMALGERVAALTSAALAAADSDDEHGLAGGAAGTDAAALKASSVSTALSQALAAGDEVRVERCLWAATSASWIDSTVAGLSSADAAVLLKLLVRKLDSRPARGRTLAAWLRAVLHTHTASLLGSPGLAPTLAQLHSVLAARLAASGPLLRLSGRLDLVLAAAGQALA